MKTDPNDSAFPVVVGDYNKGLTKRELLSSNILCALIGGGYNINATLEIIAVKAADALIAELNKEQ